jgi:hypothetical protein
MAMLSKGVWKKVSVITYRVEPESVFGIANIFWASGKFVIISTQLWTALVLTLLVVVLSKGVCKLKLILCLYVSIDVLSCFQRDLLVMTSLPINFLALR